MNVLEVRPLLFQVRALQTQGVSVFGACIWDKTQDPSITPRMVEDNNDIQWFEWFPKGNPVSSLISKERFFYQIFQKVKIDIVQINGLRDLFAVYCARMFSPVKPKIIVTSHNPGIWKSSRQKFINARFIDLFSDGIITLSTKNQKLIKGQGINEKKICFIPNAFLGESVDLIRKNRNDGEVILFYPATIIPRKNQMLILKLVDRLKDKYFISVFLAGNLDADAQYTNLLQEFCRRRGIEERIHFLGKIPRHEVLAQFAQCDLVVFPTLAEMMPRAVIEAMWLGKPVIASAVDGILDLVEDQETGLLVNADDVEGFAAAMSKLVENPAEALRMARNGQVFVRQTCSLENVGRLMIDFYNRISNSGIN
jgi:glycosyltransferase involved in cell wall biosynthesis